MSEDKGLGLSRFSRCDYRRVIPICHFLKLGLQLRVAGDSSTRPRTSQACSSGFITGNQVRVLKNMTARTVSFPRLMVCSMFSLIQTVPASCIPPQVLKPIIAGNSVVMTSLISFRGRPNKRLKHQAVNVTAILPASWTTQTDSLIPATRPTRFEDSPGDVLLQAVSPRYHPFQAADAPVVRHLVEPFPTGNCPPHLAHLSTPG